MARQRVFRERQRAQLVAVGTHLPGVARERQSAIGLPSDALIELVLQWRLGMEVKATRFGAARVR